MQELVIAYLREKWKTTKHVICLRFSRREFLQQCLRYMRGSPFVLKSKSQSPYFHEQ